LKKCSIIDNITFQLVIIHQHEFIHRDLSPENILIIGDIAKICDFGLFRESGLTDNFGKLTYMPPEVRTAYQIDLKQSFDVYSIGVIIIEVFTQLILREEMLTEKFIKKEDDIDFVVTFIKSLNLEDCWWKEIALKCTEFNEAKRPSMEEINALFKNKRELIIISCTQKIKGHSFVKHFSNISFFK